jgi:hypothetical protein
MTISVVADIRFTFFVVLLRRVIHTTPIAAIKQNTPASAAPIIMPGFVLTDSPPELELKVFALIVLDAVFSGAVSLRDHLHCGKRLHANTKHQLYSGSVEWFLRIILFCGQFIQYGSYLYDSKIH